MSHLDLSYERAISGLRMVLMTLDDSHPGCWGGGDAVRPRPRRADFVSKPQAETARADGAGGGGHLLPLSAWLLGAL